MKRAMQLAAVIAATFAALLLTGVINETYVLLFFGLLGMQVDVTATMLKRGLEAFTKSDWAGLASISTPLLMAALLAYFIRSLVYLVATVLFVLWSVPYIKRAFSSLRSIEASIEEDWSDHGESERRATVVRALRSRAAKKRVESYTFLTAALLSLAIAIGFVTRDLGDKRPEALSYDATSTFDAMYKAESVLRDVREANTQRDQDLLGHERELVSMVSNEISQIGDLSTEARIKSNQQVLAALLARQSFVNNSPIGTASEVAKEYLVFARAQLDVVNRQSEIEVIQHTALVIVTKVAAVVLILALARVLVRLYQRGLSMAVHYEAIADAIHVSAQDLSIGLSELRALMTPNQPFESEATPPKSTLHALAQLLSKTKGDSDK